MLKKTALFLHDGFPNKILQHVSYDITDGHKLILVEGIPTMFSWENIEMFDGQFCRRLSSYIAKPVFVVRDVDGIGMRIYRDHCYCREILGSPTSPSFLVAVSVHGRVCTWPPAAAMLNYTIPLLLPILELETLEDGKEEE